MEVLFVLGGCLAGIAIGFCFAAMLYSGKSGQVTENALDCMIQSRQMVKNFLDGLAKHVKEEMGMDNRLYRFCLEESAKQSMEMADIECRRMMFHLGAPEKERKTPNAPLSGGEK